MEKLLFRNMYNARYAIGGYAAFNVFVWFSWMKP